MKPMDKKSLSERDIRTTFITPVLRRAGWDDMGQIREELAFTKGRITVRGKLVSRGEGKRADYVLILQAQDSPRRRGSQGQHSRYRRRDEAGAGLRRDSNIPFAFSSNGDGFVFHDRTGTGAERESSTSRPPPRSVSPRRPRRRTTPPTSTTSDFIETGIPKMTGTAGQKRVPAGYFANSPFPSPPARRAASHRHKGR